MLKWLLILFALGLKSVAVAQNFTCTICDDGMDPPDPTALAAIPGLGNIPCGQLGVVLSQLDEESCEGFRFLASSACGCAPPVDGCTLCEGGAEPATPALVLDEDIGLTCGDVAGSLLFISNSSDTCINATLSPAIACGCPNATSSCTLCEDGLPPPDLDLVVDGETCAAAVMDASFVPDPFCTPYQATAGVYCGCNNTIASEGFCRICGDDTLLPDPNRVLTDATGNEFTCGELEFNADDLPCSTLQALYSEGCCTDLTFNVTNGTLCNVCADGSLPSLNTSIFIEGSGEFSCSLLSAIPGLTDDECEGFQFSAGEACGCPTTNATDVCTICPDGSTPTFEGNVTIPEFGELNCAGLAAVPLLTDEQCSGLQFFAAPCGCPGPNLANPCTLCSDGGMPSNTDFLLADENGDGATCGELATRLPFITNDSATCLPAFNSPDVQQICGCPGVAPSCTLCESGNVTDPTLVIAGETCGTYDTLVAGSIPEEQCTSFQATAGVYCGCDNAAASVGFCRICGGDLLLPDTNIVIEFNGENITCGEAEFNDMGLPCPDLQSTFSAACCAPTPITPPPVTAVPVEPNVTEAPTDAPNVTAAPVTPAPITAAPIPVPVTPAPIDPTPVPVPPMTPAPTNATVPAPPAPGTPAPAPTSGGALLGSVFSAITCVVIGTFVSVFA